MKETVHISLMTSKDITGVWDIEKLCFSIPWSIEAFRLEVEQNQCARYFVAYIDDQVVAYGGMWLILDEAHITNIAVHPDYRRQSLGRLIMQTLMREAARVNIERMTLEVRVSNSPAIHLYTLLGFEEGGIRKGYYANNREDALIMWNFYIGRFIDDENKEEV
ncbi:MAG: ribosomal protein S18-alanine N-acetyltransferase [Firmicutes bacterium]|nr:ribosomal protein S18-alanine N-acetyltransferase [Bacillota bacterium]